MIKPNEEIAAMNLRVLQRDHALKNTEKILQTVKFVVLAKYDEEGKHWNYLKIRGPMFLLVDRFGSHRLAVMNQMDDHNQVIPLNKEMHFELCKVENGEGFMLNYLKEDSITKRSIFGIWSADQQISELYLQIKQILL